MQYIIPIQTSGVHWQVFTDVGLEIFSCWNDPQQPVAMGIQTDHAAANETSLVMALRPDLVKMENLSKDLNQWPRAISGEDPRLHANADTGRIIIRRNLGLMQELLHKALAKLAPGEDEKD
jgi:creatinine amidohydrolase/Fe(II)-dependent formamide hydrolase-like protein